MPLSGVREGRPRTIDVTKDVMKDIWDQIAVGDELRRLVERRLCPRGFRR